MLKKLALKRLTRSDLTAFDHIYHHQQGNSRQKAINLNSEVFIGQLYPDLPKYLGLRGGHIEISTEILGPEYEDDWHSPTNRTITSKTDKQKNWRLAGNLIKNPSENPSRYNFLEPDDLVIFDFIGENHPEKVRMLLVNKKDQATYSNLNQFIPGERVSMIGLTLDQLQKISDSKLITNFINFDIQTNQIEPKKEQEIIQTSIFENPGIDLLTKQKVFKPKAHILKLLGDELIKSPVMAIYELIKNSYDADSSEVVVNFRNLNDVEKTKIVVSDQGTGITEEVLLNVWLEPGSDFRKPVDKEGNRQIKRTPIYKRVPMGEKGIGRFAVHKLGEHIKLTTRPVQVILDSSGNYVESRLLDYELEVQIDWRAFSQSKYLEDVPVSWDRKEDSEEFYFKDHSGTKIEISGIKEEWTRGMARQLKRSTLAMLSPKVRENPFKINLDFSNNWLAGLPDTKEVLEQAPYKMSALLDKNYNLTFEYTFELQNNSSIGKRIISSYEEKYNKNVKGGIRPYIREYLLEKEYPDNIIEKKLEEFDNQPIPFGEVMLEIYSYDLDSKSLKDTSNTPDIIKKVLEDHAGIKVFKDDLRVFDYGEPGNDWLGLDLKRVQQNKWFSNNQVIGYVFLNSEISSVLVEKTNREGFVHNDYYQLLVRILEFLLYQFMIERQKDRTIWRVFNQKEVSGSFERHISHLRSVIETTDLDNEHKKTKLLLEADRIEKIYQDRQETLLLPAGVGLTASVALHEIDKLVPRMEETVKSKPIHELLIENQVQELKGYISGILSMLKKGGDEELDVKEALNQAIANYSLKLKLRKIETEIVIDNDNLIVKCDKRYFITMLMNLIDNSIYWLDTVYSDHKSIYINCFQSEKYIHIFVADNGPGFMDDPEELVKPFHTRKKGGIGLGLYIIDTLMVRYGKLNIYTTKENLRKIPIDYNGAIIELAFNK